MWARFAVAVLSVFFLVSSLRAESPPKSEKIYILIPNLHKDGTGDITVNVFLARSFQEHGYEVEFLVPRESHEALLSIRGDSLKSNRVHLLSGDFSTLPEAMRVYSLNSMLLPESLAPEFRSHINMAESVFLSENDTPYPMPLHFVPGVGERSKLFAFVRGKIQKPILNQDIDLGLAIFGRQSLGPHDPALTEFTELFENYAKALRSLANQNKRRLVLFYRKPDKNFRPPNLNTAFFQIEELPRFVSTDSMAALMRESRYAPLITSGALFPLAMALERFPLLHLRLHAREAWERFRDLLPRSIATRAEAHVRILRSELSLALEHENALDDPVVAAMMRLNGINSFEQLLPKVDAATIRALLLEPLRDPALAFVDSRWKDFDFFVAHLRSLAARPLKPGLAATYLAMFKQTTSVDPASVSLLSAGSPAEEQATQMAGVMAALFGIAPGRCETKSLGKKPWQN